MAASSARQNSTWSCLKSANFADFPSLFSSIISERQAFVSQGSGAAQSFISHINTCLSSSNTRLEGLLLLNHVLEQCPPSILGNAALSWIGQLTNILQSYETTVVHQVSCSVLTTILTKIKGSTELSHEASVSHIPQVLTALLNAKDQWNLSAIQCLTACMENFSGPCGPVKEKIEKCLLPYLEGADPESWQVIGACYSLLPTCGGGGHQGIKHTEAWETHFTNVLGSLQLTLTDLYKGLEDEDDLPTPGATLRGLETISEADGDRFFKLANRFLALTKCLTSMFRRQYGFSLRVPAKEVLNFICRCLCINAKFLESRPSTDRLLLATVVSHVHQGALDNLEALIHTCRTTLLPQANIVSKLLLQSLAWTAQNNEPSKSRSYSNLRQSVYSCLILWLKVCGTIPSVDNFVQPVLMDVKPSSNVLTLDANAPKLSDAQELMSNRKKRKKQMGQAAVIGSSTKVGHGTNMEVCSKALMALRHILLSAGHHLKARTLQDVESFSIPLLLSLQGGTLPPPYGETSCRLELYHLLRVLMLTSHPTWQPPVHCIINLFSTGQRDNNVEISSFAMESLAMCTALIHPKVPTQYRPPVVLNREIKEKESLPRTVFNERIVITTENGGEGETSGSLKESELEIEHVELCEEGGFNRPEEKNLMFEEHNLEEDVKGAEDVKESGDEDAEMVEDLEDEGEMEEDEGNEKEESTVEVGHREEGGAKEEKENVVAKKRKLETEEKQDSGPVEKARCPTPQPSSSGTTQDTDSPPTVVDSMLMSFVDADPDSE